MSNNKIYIHIKRLIYLSFFITLVVFCFNLDIFSSYNTYQKIFECPFLLVFYGLTKIMSFQLAYVLMYILTFILLADSSSLIRLSKKYIVLFKKLIDIKREPTSNDEEYIAQTNKMIDLMEKEQFSLTTIFLSLLSTFLYVNFMIVMLSEIKTFEPLLQIEKTFLWFNFNESNLLLFILTIIFVITSHIILILTSKKEKNIKILKILFYLAGISLLLNPIYNYPAFDLFFIFLTLKTIIVKLFNTFIKKEDALNEKNSF